jgi:hypothetical protein
VDEIRKLLAKYKTFEDQFTKSLMGLSVASKQGYSEIFALTHNERKILAEVLMDKAEAENPKNKQSQKMIPGEINGPSPATAEKIQPR